MVKNDEKNLESYVFSDQDFLEGQMFIVMFGMMDLCFEKIVIYFCVYLENGVMGFVVNK